MDFIPTIDLVKQFTSENEPNNVTKDKRFLQHCLYPTLKSMIDEKTKSDQDFLKKMVPIRLSKILLTLPKVPDDNRLLVDLKPFYLNQPDNFKQLVVKEIKFFLNVKGFSVKDINYQLDTLIILCMDDNDLLLESTNQIIKLLGENV